MGANRALVASDQARAGLGPSGFDHGYWQPIDTAPRDGTPIQAVIPGNGSDNVIAFHLGFLDSNENDCGSWVFVSEQEPPECWTDGVCWEVNEDGKPSVRPTQWKPLPSATQSTGEAA